MVEAFTIPLLFNSSFVIRICLLALLQNPAKGVLETEEEEKEPEEETEDKEPEEEGTATLEIEDKEKAQLVFVRKYRQNKVTRYIFYRANINKKVSEELKKWLKDHNFFEFKADSLAFEKIEIEYPGLAEKIIINNPASFPPQLALIFVLFKHYDFWKRTTL